MEITKNDNPYIFVLTIEHSEDWAEVYAFEKFQDANQFATARAKFIAKAKWGAEAPPENWSEYNQRIVDDFLPGSLIAISEVPLRKTS